MELQRHRRCLHSTRQSPADKGHGSRPRQQQQPMTWSASSDSFNMPHHSPRILWMAAQSIFAFLVFYFFQSGIVMVLMHFEVSQQLLMFFAAGGGNNTHKVATTSKPKEQEHDNQENDRSKSPA